MYHQLTHAQALAKMTLSQQREVGLCLSDATNPQHKNKHRFYPCVSAVASLASDASVAFVAYVIAFVVFVAWLC